MTNIQTAITIVGEIIIACISGFCLVHVAQLKQHINSRMDELLNLTRDAAHAQGKMEGKAEERADAALIAKSTLTKK